MEGKSLRFDNGFPALPRCQSDPVHSPTPASPKARALEPNKPRAASRAGRCRYGGRSWPGNTRAEYLNGFCWRSVVTPATNHRAVGNIAARTTPVPVVSIRETGVSVAGSPRFVFAGLIVNHSAL